MEVIPLGAKMNEEGIWVDYSGNEIDSYLPDQLSTVRDDHLAYYARGSWDESLTTAEGSDTLYTVCEKATTGSATTTTTTMITTTSSTTSTSLSEDSEGKLILLCLTRKI